MTDDLRHKRKPPSVNGREPRSMCGQYGYVFAMWSKVNCPACLRKRKVTKR